MSCMRETCKVLTVTQYATGEQTKDSYSLFTDSWNISVHQRQIYIKSYNLFWSQNASHRIQHKPFQNPIAGEPFHWECCMPEKL